MLHSRSAINISTNNNCQASYWYKVSVLLGLSWYNYVHPACRNNNKPVFGCMKWYYFHKGMNTRCFSKHMKPCIIQRWKFFSIQQIYNFIDFKRLVFGNKRCQTWSKKLENEGIQALGEGGPF
jgi:hypothetical protein